MTAVFPLPATVPPRFLDPRFHGAKWIPAYVLRRAVWEASGRCCYLCKQPVSRDAVSLDHVIPRYLIRWTNRKHHFANLRASHVGCNKAKGRRLYLRHARIMLRAAVAIIRTVGH